MDKYVIANVSYFLMNPLVNVLHGEYDNLSEAILHGPKSAPGLNNQYVVVKKGDVDSVGNAKSVKIVHLF